MKVAVFKDLQNIEFKDKPKPGIQAEEALVKVEYCGICGSDVHGYLNGVLVAPGTVMGHECSGLVAEVGEEVEGFQTGDRVAVKPIPQCGECYWCHRGQYSLCSKALERAVGITPDNDGAFAPYMRVRYPGKMLFKLPPEVSLKDAALIEPLATALHGVRMSGFKPGDRVVIIGAGMIGLGVLQFLKIGGAGKVIVLEISPQKSSLALELGADVALNPFEEGQDLKERILNLTSGIGADLVFAGI